jgi:hypothetical protein
VKPNLVQSQSIASLTSAYARTGITVLDGIERFGRMTSRA